MNKTDEEIPAQENDPLKASFPDEGIGDRDLILVGGYMPEDHGISSLLRLHLHDPDHFGKEWIADPLYKKRQGIGFTAL